MITLRTKTEKDVHNKPKRINETAKVYLKIRIDKISPIIIASGEYYYLDADENYVFLSNFVPKSFTYEELETFEDNWFEDFTNVRNLIPNIKKRIVDMTIQIIEAEAAQGKVNNYGITSGSELELVE